MADNIPILDNNGAVRNVATNQIGTVDFQRSKLVIGASGAAVDVEPPDTSGQSAAKTLPAGAVVWDTALAKFVPVWNAKSVPDSSNGAGTLSVQPTLYNETTFDLQRSNAAVTLLAAAARTASVIGAVQTNHNARGVVAVLDISAIAGGGLTVRLTGIANGHAYSIAAAPAIANAVGTYAYEFYPGATTAAVVGPPNVVQRVSAVVPRTFRVDVTASDGSSITYSLDLAWCL